jgi:hypothetical protein
VVVRRPRAGDALGHALRQSFDGAANLPDDFSRYLHQLDRITSQY